MQFSIDGNVFLKTTRQGLGVGEPNQGAGPIYFYD
jgi:hypothetical protein